MAVNEAPSSDPGPDRFDFAWDIVMALRDTKLCRGGGRRLMLDDKTALERTILNHLKISGVLISRKPPLGGPGRWLPCRDDCW